MSQAGGLTEEQVVAAIGADRQLGGPVRVHPVVTSTEALALGWARQKDAPEGALVTADQELSARVRRGVPWVSHAGRSLAFSVVLRPDLPPEGEGLLWLLASLAAAEGVERLGDVDVRLKWPNDLLIAHKRLGGVRIDARLGPGVVELAVVTFRLNVGGTADDFPETLRAEVTTLEAEGVTSDRLAVMAAVLEQLEQRYGAGVQELLAAYKERCDTLGRRVRAQLLMTTQEASGVATDVSPGGGLVLRTPGGAGTVSVDQLARLDVSS